MTLFWSVLGASIGSALLPLINIEIILTGAVSQAPGHEWALVIAATIGQMLGKILWYWGGTHVERAPWVNRQLQKPAAKASLDKWHERAEGRPWFTAGLLFVSAFSGFPPYAVTAVLAGILRVPMWIFLVTGTLGRGLRFWVVVFGASSLFGWLS
ncbi:membrane protein YqaA, SNARE-associated domain [Nocardioides exalbidus]|uniref:Membrane protein YqaA, SNARE-associated domain n=1 Tax=Nocardioides exalbidus TaxID=402596 RepID=A0A1H4TX21_9ACTN|nr:VTT domain-containing protein [Nocardioides exalbidus]SEC61012.1 membrane protein YqaA, SNARE-associated domain [Nocardioides exalbidus]